MSAAEPPYDYAIIGAGVSGLVLAWLLCDSHLCGPGGSRTILLIDGARDDDELRTLSCWSVEPTALEPLVRHAWQVVRLQLGADAREFALRDYRYRTLFFADLQREAKARLARVGRHRLIQGRVRALTEDAEGVTLTVGDAPLRARLVFDSRFHLPALTVDTGRFHLLRQHFHGWVVRVPRDVFDPAAATLFDFRVDAPAGRAFVYVLPMSPREALVELVTLDTMDAEPVLRAYLQRAFGLAPEHVEIVDREAGVSPMTEQPFPWAAGARVRRIGIAAGRVKASTGYALTRILQDCAGIVAGLEQRGALVPPPAAPGLYRVMDAVLLEVWEREPAAIPGIFQALFAKNPADRVFAFLDERSRLRDILRMAASLPWAPMVRAVLRWLWRRLRRRPPPP